jgi:hypothetical protein
MSQITLISGIEKQILDGFYALGLRIFYFLSQAI